MLEFLEACRKQEIEEYKRLRLLTLQAISANAQVDLERGFPDAAIRKCAIAAIKTNGTEESELAVFDQVLRRSVWENRVCCTIMHPKNDYLDETRSLTVSSCGKVLLYRDRQGTSFLYSLPYQYTSNIESFDPSIHMHVLDDGFLVSSKTVLYVSVRNNFRLQ